MIYEKRKKVSLWIEWLMDKNVHRGPSVLENVYGILFSKHLNTIKQNSITMNAFSDINLRYIWQIKYSNEIYIKCYVKN